MIILRTRTAHDFRHYKRATVLRRIERRLQVNSFSDLQQYREYLHVHPEETAALLQDMLISATNFFRDKEAYEALRNEVLPIVFRNRTAEEPVRVWAAGCATGEEAYSITMLLQEASAQTSEHVPFQVFATDIAERAINIAREGVYLESIAADVDAVRMKQFFSKEGGQYRIKKELRERVLFALHNVLSDPPFSRLDLICCRNLLIYLDREAQVDILRTFHFALRPGGHLFLGTSEAADTVGGLFSVVDKKARIFRANVAVRTDTPLPIAASGSHGMRPTLSVLQPPGKRKFSFGDLHQRLVEQYAPPSVLVNRESEIVHLSDRAGRFLHYAGGEPSHNILAAVRPELRLELRTAIYQALHTQRSVEARRVRMDREGRSFFVNMIARLVHDEEANADFILVLFDEVEDSMSGTSGGQTDDQRDPIIAQLERELSVTDDGIGIDSTMLPHIFNMFQQGRLNTAAKRGGLGIGLSLVKELVAVHGGRVEAHSDGLGHGAAFTVELPRIIGATSDAGGVAYPSTFLNGAAILLVDDDTETVETFKLLLEMEGANVTVATNGEQALQMLDGTPPSLILSDLGMPGISGFEFIEAVRRRPELGHVKAIALSGFGRQGDVEDALHAGFDAHLTKPVMLDALLSTIARLRAQ